MEAGYLLPGELCNFLVNESGWGCCTQLLAVSNQMQKKERKNAWSLYHWYLEMSQICTVYECCCEWHVWHSSSGTSCNSKECFPPKCSPSFIYCIHISLLTGRVLCWFKQWKWCNFESPVCGRSRIDLGIPEIVSPTSQLRFPGCAFPKKKNVQETNVRPVTLWTFHLYEN